MGPNTLAIALKNTYKTLDVSTLAIEPKEFIYTLMNIFPHFAERKGSSFVQQDAEECFSGILSTLDGTALAGVLDDQFA